MLIHYIIKFNQTFALVKKETLNFDLRRLNCLTDHGIFNNLVLLNFEKIHHFGNLLTTKNSHDFVIKTDEKLRRTRITLPTTATTQLIINPP
ncbi:hypothetical protein SDC9_128276 [bioreactor metagenome]|uniref:Uncharacterized protein n=1 Tax=bioreactor metagenome TaxID=1076179 RepID=A0A645CWC3_9ZZZZ